MRGRCVVAFARVHPELVAVFLSRDVDGTVVAVALEGSGLVRDEIAATDDLLEIGEASVEAVQRARDKGGATSEFGKGPQRMVAQHGARLSIEFILSAHGVDRHFTALSKLREQAPITELAIVSNFGGLEHWKVIKTQELFARHVMPAFRAGE